MKTRHVLVVAISALHALLLLAGDAAARPRYPQDDVNDKDHLRRIHDAMDPVNKDPALFDGARIPAPASVDLAQGAAWVEGGIKALQEFRYQWDQLTDVGKTWDDAVKLKAKYDDIKPYFEAAQPAFRQLAIDRAEANAARQRTEAAKTAADKTATDKATADKAAADKAANSKIATECAGINNGLQSADDRHAMAMANSIMAGSGYLSSPKAVNDMRALLERMGKVCQGISDPGQCSGRFEELKPSQICELTRHSTEIIQTGVLATLAGADNSRPITLEQLRGHDGWIETTQPFSFAKDLTFTPEARAALIKQYQPLFDAAGMTVPDKHPLWDRMQASKDTSRTAIETLAPTWPVPGKTCKGYWCAKAKKALKEFHPKAKLLKVLMDDTVHVTTSGGRAIEAYLNGWLLYQLPGEKWCQLRAWTVTENSPSRAAGVPLYFVRIQKCK